MSDLIVFLSVLTLLGLCSAAFVSVPKCHLSDSKCLKSSAAAALPTVAAGIPEFGTEPLDVMHLNQVIINLAGLNMILTDVNAIGIKDAIITKMRVDITKKKIHVVTHLDISIKGKYKASGQLLILPISGDGDCDIKLTNLYYDLTMPFVMTKNAEGRDIIKIKSFTYTYEVKDGAVFLYTNLFHGNKELSDAMLTFMNQNWKILTEEFGKPLLDAASEKIVYTIRKLLMAQPIDEIALV